MSSASAPTTPTSRPGRVTGRSGPPPLSTSVPLSSIHPQPPAQPASQAQDSIEPLSSSSSSPLQSPSLPGPPSPAASGRSSGISPRALALRVKGRFSGQQALQQALPPLPIPPMSSDPTPPGRVSASGSHSQPDLGRTTPVRSQTPFRPSSRSASRNGSRSASRASRPLSRPASSASISDEEPHAEQVQLARIQHTLAGDAQVVRVLDDATGEVFDLQLFRSEAYPRLAPARPTSPAPWRTASNPPQSNSSLDSQHAEPDWLSRFDMMGILHRLRAAASTPSLTPAPAPSSLPPSQPPSKPPTLPGSTTSQHTALSVPVGSESTAPQANVLSDPISFSPSATYPDADSPPERWVTHSTHLSEPGPKPDRSPPLDKPPATAPLEKLAQASASSPTLVPNRYQDLSAAAPLADASNSTRAAPTPVASEVDKREDGVEETLTSPPPSAPADRSQACTPSTNTSPYDFLSTAPGSVTSDTSTIERHSSSLTLSTHASQSSLGLRALAWLRPSSARGHAEQEQSKWNVFRRRPSAGSQGTISKDQSANASSTSLGHGDWFRRGPTLPTPYAPSTSSMHTAPAPSSTAPTTPSVRAARTTATGSSPALPALVVQPPGSAGLKRPLSPILGSANPLAPPPTVHTGDASFDQEANANAQRMYWARRGKIQRRAPTQEGMLPEEGAAPRALPKAKSSESLVPARARKASDATSVPGVGGVSMGATSTGIPGLEGVRPRKGKFIDASHANYVLMYHMLTGIRIGVSRAQHRPPRSRLTEADFKAQHKFTFDIVGNEMEPGPARTWPYDFKFKDYAPLVFRSLRETFKLDTADYLLSLTSKYILSELGSPGKSGSFFYYSGDYRFIIKTIRRAEHAFLLSILPAYHAHIQANPQTLLSRFYGLHRVKLPGGRKVHFVVMNNLFPPHMDIHETYDLKGSTHGREYPEQRLAEKPGGAAAAGVVMKDVNWVRRQRKILLAPDKRRAFEKQLKADVALLARLKIMDYSLLIGIHDVARGNKENFRQAGLHLFQAQAEPGTPTTPDDPHHPKLARAPSTLRPTAENASALRMAVSRSDPTSLEQDPPAVVLGGKQGTDLKHTLFYADEGGMRSSEVDDEGKEVFRGEIYFMGVIDILTSYNSLKRGEHLYKTVVTSDASTISALPPQSYSQRFLNFILTATDPLKQWPLAPPPGSAYKRYPSLPLELSPVRTGQMGSTSSWGGSRVHLGLRSRPEDATSSSTSTSTPSGSRARAYSLGAARSLWPTISRGSNKDP